MLQTNSVDDFREHPGQRLSARRYQLKCPSCGYLFEDDGLVLVCPRPHTSSLLTTVYSSTKLLCDDKADGIYRFRCWLPVARRFDGSDSPVTYKSERLNRLLGLPKLWILFSGYWPERGATLQAGTFKELGVYGVLSRMRHSAGNILVVASAGNTAAAYAKVCSENGIPCLLVLPESGVGALQFPSQLEGCVKIVCLTGNGDYCEAVAFAEAISRREGFVCEGGVRNVGCRDGLGTAMLSAVETMGALPNYYFQAIGSGAGAIAAHEAAKRLVRDWRLSPPLPRLMLCQNLPFAPVFDAWRKGGRELLRGERSQARALTAEISAGALSHRRPAYSVAGGIFDALKESRGDMFAASNGEIRCAKQLFEDCEGVDIDPAAGVTLAALIQAIRSRRISPAATVALHVTGGGYRKMASERKLIQACPDLEIPSTAAEMEAAVAKACELF